MIALKYEDANTRKEKKLKGQYMVLVIKNMWKKRNRRWGGEKSVQHRNRIRHYFYTYGLAMNFCHYTRAKDLLKPLLVEWFEVEKMKNTFRTYYNGICYI